MQKYMHEDNDVAVFTKVFRNEIDEEFRKVQTQIKETVADLLRIHLKSKHRLKSDEVITEHLKRKTTGHLSQDEWKSVVKYMFSTLTFNLFEFIDVVYVFDLFYGIEHSAIL